MLAIAPYDALLIVDMQVDYCPGGALPVREGQQIIPLLNRWIRAFEEAGQPVFASRDWHPADHVAFQAQGGAWPAHCVQHTLGAEFHPDLVLPDDVVVVSKGVNPRHHARSAFDGTDLTDCLRTLGIKRLSVAGLALDDAVLASVLDGLKAGFVLRLLRDASRAMEDQAGERALAQMRWAGAEIMEGWAVEHATA